MNCAANESTGRLAPFRYVRSLGWLSSLNLATENVLKSQSHTTDLVFTTAGLAVREVSVRSVDAAFEQQWMRLESASLDGNAFLSPSFVRSLERNLPQKTSPFIVAIEEETAGTLTGLGVFEEVRGSRLLPMTHLRSWETEFGFTAGFLLDACHAEATAAALFGWLKANGNRWNGLAFSNLPAESQNTQVLLASAERAGHSWREDSRSARACLRVAEIPDDVMTLYSKSRRKSLRQNLRKLESHGEVRFRIHTQDSDGRLLGEFLRLESSGWKGEGNTALGSDSNLTAFSREWTTALNESGQLAICELSVDGRSVAMSLNPICGETMFAFKIGWEESFAACSPGTLCEWLTLQSLQSHLPQIRFVDSCSQPGSYVEKIWPWTFELTDGVFPTTWPGSLAVDSMLRIKQVKRLLRG
ncbi:MAG: GNAT family N-acetyltransferase [Planctomycetes bacterium]|nr:GNAT family N-acetyltransferase [Planctomycetota bacterium]